ncbi:MAG: sporulation integral membrane protein YtvI [Lachnospiraceae bacterium]|nr:sporulation integral membrane protein YtvI [Lachnospiraceae bacterium]
MKKSTLYLKAMANVMFYIVAFILTILFLPRLVVFFLPFVLAWFVSLIANPVVKFFEEKIKVKRKAVSAIMIVLIIAVIILATYGIIVLLVNQGMGLARSVPEKWDTWKQELNNLGSSVNDLFRNLPAGIRDTFADLGNKIETAISDFVKHLGTGDIGSKVVAAISPLVGSVASTLISVIMFVLSAYFFTAEHNNLVNTMEKYMSPALYSKMQAAYKGLKNAVGGYFKAQLQIEMWIYLITVLGLVIGRVDFAIIIALGIAILDFLPFFGAGLIMVPWAAICFANQNYYLAITLIVTWGVGQLVRQLIQPKIVGDNVGFKPLPTLILMFVGYKLIGVIGMIIAIPIAMIAVSLYQEGVFDSFTRSLKILWDGLTRFRRIPKDYDIKENTSNEKDR